MTRRLATLALIGAAACGDARDARQAESTAATTPSGSATVDLDSLATVQRAESLAIAQDAWNAVEVVSRLEQAGLVVRDLERPVSAPGFEIEGAMLSVSGGELIVFLYPSARERVAVTAALDSASAAPPNTPSPWSGTPRLITSGNLAAVLVTEREQLAERVRNVLSARHVGTGR